jgi:hypothetical protein
VVIDDHHRLNDLRPVPRAGEGNSRRDRGVEAVGFGIVAAIGFEHDGEPKRPPELSLDGLQRAVSASFDGVGDEAVELDRDAGIPGQDECDVARRSADSRSQIGYGHESPLIHQDDLPTSLFKTRSQR